MAISPEIARMIEYPMAIPRRCHLRCLLADICCKEKLALAVELIPPQYNMQTTLSAKVEAGKPNVFDFPLSKTAVATKIIESNRRPR
jgi:hypothetical protein